MRLIQVTTRAFEDLVEKRGNNFALKEVEQRMHQFDRARISFSAPIVNSLNVQEQQESNDGQILLQSTSQYV
jgi:hypothetical protein